MHLQITSYHQLEEVIGCLGKPQSLGVVAEMKEWEDINRIKVLSKSWNAGCDSASF